MKRIPVLFKRRPSVLWAAAIMLLTVLLASGAALAITGGTKDEKDPTTGQFKYPNVGALVARSGAYCSGTLVPGKTDTPVFVTAAHCAPNRGNTVYVTFDSAYDRERSLFPNGPGVEYKGTIYADNTNDIAVVKFASTSTPPSTIPLAQLPALGEFADTAKGDEFTAVGYGATSGSSNDYGERRYAVSTFKSVDRTYLRLSQHNGSGGTCYGDSGGPNFFGGVNETNVIAGITITGDTWCKSTNVTLRLDTEPVRNFLRDYVTLP